MTALNAKSHSRLVGVRHELVGVVEQAAAEIEKIFGMNVEISEGLRTIDRQKQLVASGASQTMNSRHITGHAIDIYAIVGGEANYSWPLYYNIAFGMQKAAKEKGVTIVWGGVWDRTLNELGDDLQDEMLEYAIRRKALGKRPFHDGPHFELERKAYP